MNKESTKEVFNELYHTLSQILRYTRIRTVKKGGWGVRDSYIDRQSSNGEGEKDRQMDKQTDRDRYG